MNVIANSYPVFWLMLLVSISFAGEPQSVSVAELGKSFNLVGKLHAPLGTVVAFEGVVVEGPMKGDEGGPNMRIQRIGGKYYQEDIQIVLQPFFYDWGAKATVGGDALPKLEPGMSYAMEGYETGGFSGVPTEVFKRGAVVVQTTPHHFRSHVVVTKAKQAKPIIYSPAMFPGQNALLEGTARTKDGSATLSGESWTVVIVRGKAWTDDVEGKHIETFGMYQSAASQTDNPVAVSKQYDLINGTWRFVDLKEQVGREVRLRGRAESLNDVWWFNYRGTAIYVENMQQLPGWSADNHWRPMEIVGRLEQAKLPRIDQVAIKATRDLQEHYIVRNAAWRPLSGLLFPERPIETE